MNDIEILEDYVKELNKNKEKHKLAYSTGFGKYWSDFGVAIENLIQRNKELESDNYECNNIINDYIDTVKKKDKIINLMAERLEHDTEWFFSEFDNYKKQDFIEYFTNKVEEDK